MIGVASAEPPPCTSRHLFPIPRISAARDPGAAFLGPNCLDFPQHLGAVLPSGALGRMTIGRLMLVRAAASAAALQSAAKSLGTFAVGWRPRPSRRHSGR